MDLWNRLNEMNRDMAGMMADMLGNVANIDRATQQERKDTHKTNAIKKFYDAKLIMMRMEDELHKD